MIYIYILKIDKKFSCEGLFFYPFQFDENGNFINPNNVQKFYLFNFFKKCPPTLNPKIKIIQKFEK